MLYLFLTLAAVLIIVPLTLEWLTKGWHGTVVAKAWAEISPSFGAFTRHVARRNSAESDVASAIVAVGSEAEAEQANTKPLSQANATSDIKKADFLTLLFLFLITISGYDIYSKLTPIDSILWVNDQDRQFWPIVVPIVQISILACAQYIFWDGFRLPIGATFVCLALLTGEWIDRYVSFWGWTFYPITLVWPTSIIPMALYIDIVLLLSKSWIVTAIIGVMGYSPLMYSNNWVILAPYDQPVEQYGFLLTLGQVMGLRYNHPSTLEIYMWFFPGIVGGRIFFAGFISMIVYVVSWHISKLIIKLTPANVIFSRN